LTINYLYCCILLVFFLHALLTMHGHRSIKPLAMSDSFETCWDLCVISYEMSRVGIELTLLSRGFWELIFAHLVEKLCDCRKKKMFISAHDGVTWQSHGNSPPSIITFKLIWSHYDIETTVTRYETSQTKLCRKHQRPGCSVAHRPSSDVSTTVRVWSIKKNYNSGKQVTVATRVWVSQSHQGHCLSKAGSYQKIWRTTGAEFGNLWMHFTRVFWIDKTKDSVTVLYNTGV